MKRTIAIVCGGDSSEHDVSLRSAQGLYSFFDKERYNIYIVDIKGTDWHVNLDNGHTAPINKNDFSFNNNGQTIFFDYAYITIHGRPGENGIMQGYFELVNIPYSTCDVLASALTFDKFVLNRYLKSYSIHVSESILLRIGDAYNEKEIAEKIGMPCFVKPATDGSKAFMESSEVMVESFLDGVEITQGIYKTKEKSVPFPITEVVTSNEFFDYNAKYNGEVDEITPARISKELAEKVTEVTSHIYDILHANGIIRIDYIITKDNNGNDVINMLEVNTTPGMTVTSFVPQQVKAAGLDIKDVLSDIVENQF